jgi:uncharacterized membrane protein
MLKLGATLQESKLCPKRKMIIPDYNNQKEYKHISGINILDNHQVNFISSLIVCCVSGALVSVWGNINA